MIVNIDFFEDELAAIIDACKAAKATSEFKESLGALDRAINKASSRMNEVEHAHKEFALYNKRKGDIEPSRV